VTPTSLDLGLIGNGTICALVDSTGDIVWGCFPRLDGDPTFCSLLGGDGHFAIELVDAVRHEQEYLANTAILVTRAFDDKGGAIEITDFAPRFRQYGRMFCPMMLVRRIQRLAGHPRVRVQLQATCGYGRAPRGVTFGSNHVRFVGDDGRRSCSRTPSRCCSAPTRPRRRGRARSACAFSPRPRPTGTTGCARWRSRSSGRTR
jgi:hypothetical protein